MKKGKIENDFQVFEGLKVNLTAVRSGKSNGKPMTEKELNSTLPKNRVEDGVNKDGSKKYKLVDHPKLDEICKAVMKAI
jgi:hypothetical protein